MAITDPRLRDLVDDGELAARRVSRRCAQMLAEYLDSRGLDHVDTDRLSRPVQLDEDFPDMAFSVSHLPGHLFAPAGASHYRVTRSTLARYLTPPLPAPPVEVVVVRDTGGPTDITVFVAGEPVRAKEFHIDPGAGYTAETWGLHIAACLRDASAHARACIQTKVLALPANSYGFGT